MGKIEELPDDFDESLNLNAGATNTSPPPSNLPNGPGPTGIPSLESLINNAAQSNGTSTAEVPSDGKPSAPKPPAMTETASKTADQLLAELNRTPLFMTSLDETDGQGGENAALEGLKALAYEGTKAEVAGNFREQGNECARAKQWLDAREFYTKGITVLRGPARPQHNEGDEDPDMDLAEGQELDPEEEARKEKQIEEASLVNRALCNLEMSRLNLFRGPGEYERLMNRCGSVAFAQVEALCSRPVDPRIGCFGFTVRLVVVGDHRLTVSSNKQKTTALASRTARPRCSLTLRMLRPGSVARVLALHLTRSPKPRIRVRVV